MKRPDTSDGSTARGDTPRHGRLVVSFVDRNWLWSRFGLGLSLILAVVIAALALMPLPDQASQVAGLDKIYHFVAFTVLVFPVIVTDTNRWSWVVPVTIAFGGVIELTQPLMGRSADWLDFGASVSGVLAGAALAEILHNRIRQSVLGAEPDLRTDLPLASEHDRLEAMRGELMSELRAVLREELEAAAQRDAAAQTLKEQNTKALTRNAPEREPSAPVAKPAAGPVAPARVSPARLKENAELRRAKIALRARDHAVDPLTDALGEVRPKRPLPPPPHSTPPGGGTPARH